MIEIYKSDGKGGGRIVHRSRNLRGIVAQAGRVGVRSAVGLHSGDPNFCGGGDLRVLFGDGTYCQTTFADYEVMVTWLRQRRSFRGVCAVEGPDGCETF